MPLRNPLLPLSILLLATGLALPGAFIAGLVALGLWFAVAVAELVVGRDGVAVLLAGLIVTAALAWLIV